MVVVESAPTGGRWLFTDTGDDIRFLLSVVVMVVCGGNVGDDDEEKWVDGWRCRSGVIVEEEKEEEDETANGKGEEKRPVDKSRCLLLTASTKDRFLRCVISFVFVLVIIIFPFVVVVDDDEIGCFWTINLTFLLLNVSLSVDGII